MLDVFAAAVDEVCEHESIKYGCELAGLPAGRVRPPLKGLTKEQRREVEVVIRTLKTTIAQIQDGEGRKEQDNVVALNA